MKNIKLNQITEIPILGFGTWQLEGEKVVKPLELALETGYRHIDMAFIYGNQKQIGKVLKENKILRKDLFITSKLWHDYMGKNEVRPALEKTLDELRTEYLDLYLIHWPNKAVSMTDTLEEFGKLKDEGRIKAIGVSNFTIRHLEEALATGIEITNNQVELHPTFNQKELRKFCEQHNISVTAYSPIGQGKDLSEKIVIDLAKKYQTSESGVILAWLRQRNIVAIPRSSDEKHIQENWDSLKVELNQDDCELMETIEQKPRLVNPGLGEFGD